MKAKVAALLRAEISEPEAVLAEEVTRLRSAGVRTAGVLAEPRSKRVGETCGAGYLRDIATGEPQQIYLDTPPVTAGCDLDSAGVDAACQRLIAQIATSDVVVLSKFGKLEAAGGGLVPAFRAAIAEGKPVLTTVSEQHLSAWKDFAPDAVLISDAAALDSWCRAAREPARTAAP